MSDRPFEKAMMEMHAQEKPKESDHHWSLNVNVLNVTNVNTTGKNSRIVSECVLNVTNSQKIYPEAFSITKTTPDVYS